MEKNLLNFWEWCNFKQPGHKPICGKVFQPFNNVVGDVLDYLYY